MNTFDSARRAGASARRSHIPKSARLRFFPQLSSLRSLLTLCALCVLFSSRARADDVLSADATSWRCLPSDGVEASISTDATASPKGPCLRLDFNFKSGGGFVVVQRNLAIDLPENYRFDFDIKAGENTRPNNLEFKLLDNGQPTDPKANSVWWVIRRAMEFPREWSHFSYKKRHFSFAWGPSGGAPLTHLAHLEFAISSAEGGKGTIWFDGLTFKETLPVRPYTGSPTAIAADSFDAEHGPEKAIDGDPKTAWFSASPGAAITIDFGQVREFGGLELSWARPLAPATQRAAPNGPYSVSLSADGEHWTAGVADWQGSHATDFLYLPDSEARYVRIFARQNGTAPALLRSLADVRIVAVSDASSTNAFVLVVAKSLPRGVFPRWAYGEQSFWTVLGVPEDSNEALINEEGQVEIGKQGYSIEPFVMDGDHLLTWADGTHTQSLAKGHLPIATVVREMQDIRLTIRAGVGGPSEESAAGIQYTLTNTGHARRSVDLVVAVRPYQVNPPAQFLNVEGGASSIRSMKTIEGGGLDVNARSEIYAGIGAEAVTTPEWTLLPSGAEAVKTPTGTPWALHTPGHDHLSAHYVVPFSLAPGESASSGVIATFRSGGRPSWLPAELGPNVLPKFLEVTEQVWKKVLSRASLSLPPSAKAIEDTFYAQQAYILINKDGPGFQPGSRSYERSWMRDGSMTSAAMLQLGYFDLVKQFTAWYATYQFPDGKVPCVVDKRGPDPVPENDSHGELIMAIANVHRYTHDDAFVKAQFDHVRKAVEYIEKLRQERMTPEYRTVPGEDGTKTKQEPGKPAVPYRAFYGLLPESISHEGYSAKPMHSYWDDLFAYRGLKDAGYCAKVVGDTDDLIRWEGLAKDFGLTLANSYALAMKTHNIDYLPGCVELGDFDATSTTVALWPVQARDILPHAALEKTFDKYWEFFTHRRDNPRDQWEAYTPYELRTINAMVHLGERDRAVAALEWFMKDQYPPGWHHWAEVVWSNPRTTKFIGDMPHTWVGSDFLNSLRSMFLYEDEANESLVVFAGVPEKWVREGEGVSFKNFRTYYGSFSAAARGEGNNITMTFEGDLALPKGGLVVQSVLAKACTKVLVDGQPVREADGGITLHAVPRTIEWRP